MVRSGRPWIGLSQRNCRVARNHRDTRSSRLCYRHVSCDWNDRNDRSGQWLAGWPGGGAWISDRSGSGLVAVRGHGKTAGTEGNECQHACSAKQGSHGAVQCGERPLLNDPGITVVVSDCRCRQVQVEFGCERGKLRGRDGKERETWRETQEAKRRQERVSSGSLKAFSALCP